MRNRSFLNFKQFSGIFEDDEKSEQGAGVKASDLIINIFFEIYGIIVTRIGGYKESIKDYQEISNSENKKRGDLMISSVNKISDLAVKKRPEIKPAIEEYKKSLSFLVQAYNKILEEDSGQLLNIKKRIKDMIISYLESLVNNVKSTKLPELEKTNESLEYFSGLILEKDLYQKERIQTIKSVLPLRAKILDLSNKSIFPEIKNVAKNSLKKYDQIVKNLQSDDFFNSKKRSERAKEIENSKFSIISMENELNDALSKIAIKYGIAKEIDDLIKKSLKLLNSANIKLEEIEKEKALEDEKKKIGDSEEGIKDDPQKNIESYGWKSLKDGEDKEIYYKKEDWDDSKSADKQKNQIGSGKIVKGSVDETKKEIKIYNEKTKKNFSKSFSDILDKSIGDKNSETKIGDSKKEEEKEYKEIKEGDKNPEAVKKIQKKLNSILPKKSLVEENGNYDNKLKEGVKNAIRIMKSISVLKPDFKEDGSKVSVELQKYIEEYIKKIEEIRKDLPKT